MKKPLLSILILLVAVAVIGFKIVEKPMIELIEKPQIVYVYDPICGWCYGFSPVVKKLQGEYESKADFKILHGGMLVGNGITTMSTMSNYISSAYQRVENLTGVTFGDSFLRGILQNPAYILDSEKPSRACIALSSLAPEKSLSIGHAIQLALYHEGKSLNDTNTYLEIAQNFKINHDIFLERFRSTEYVKLTFEEFAAASAMGAKGYPYLVLYKDGKKQVLTYGYSDYEEIKKQLDKLL